MLAQTNAPKDALHHPEHEKLAQRVFGYPGIAARDRGECRPFFRCTWTSAVRNIRHDVPGAIVSRECCLALHGRCDIARACRGFIDCRTAAPPPCLRGDEQIAPVGSNAGRRDAVYSSWCTRSTIRSMHCCCDAQPQSRRQCASDRRLWTAVTGPQKMTRANGADAGTTSPIDIIGVSTD